MNIKRTRTGHERQKNHLLDWIELKPKKKEVSIRIGGREVMKIEGNERKRFLDTQKDEIKLEAIKKVLKEGSAKQVANMLEVVDLAELIVGLTSYKELSTLQHAIDNPFDHPVANQLALLDALNDQIIQPLGMEIEAEIKEMGVKVKLEVTKLKKDE